MLTEEQKKMLREKGREDLIEIDEINSSGYAGVMQNGNIVDRRKHPEAVPVQENRLFGVARAIMLKDDPHPDCFR